MSHFIGLRPIAKQAPKSQRAGRSGEKHTSTTARYGEPDSPTMKCGRDIDEEVYKLASKRRKTRDKRGGEEVVCIPVK